MTAALGGCDGEEPVGAEVDETSAAIEAPALAPNSLVEDLPVEGGPDPGQADPD